MVVGFLLLVTPGDSVPKHNQVQPGHLLQPAPAAHHPLVGIRAAPGQLLPQHQRHPHLCLCGHLPLGRRHRPAPVVVLTPAGPHDLQLHRRHLRRRDALGHGSRHHPRHLQLVQGRPEAVHHHLWRVDPQRCRRDCHL